MDYDVIVVGGRPSGAALAARLGKRGKRVLVVDRATFPSRPAVPSSPALHSGAMALLDELGIDEAEYADEHACMRAIHMDLAGIFTAVMRIPPMAAGRDYTRGIERTTFDDVLWRNLGRFPTVERRSGFNVTNIVCRDNRVVGIVGGRKDEPTEEISAGCVIGADGRFSLVARKVGAEVVEDACQHTSTVYFADWAGVKPIADDYKAGLVYVTARGLDVIFFAMPGGRWSINTHARSDRVRIEGDAQRYYMDTLRSIPRIWQYLERAELVSPLSGIKQIGNGYRRSSGLGWALVGDALHYKDPVDGQGIYDALLGAKFLDLALESWHSGSRSWDEAMATYQRDIWTATHPMFLATTARLARELYAEPPLPVIRTLIRWTMTDPAFGECFLRVLGRDWPPEALSSKRLAAGAITRGIRRDIAHWAENRFFGKQATSVVGK
jgi:2-polyprenyl-6-methoxyphenol hydroxylase-like FAD-dependent oxidoreductase